MASPELAPPQDVPPLSRGLRDIDLLLQRRPRGMVILASGGEPEDLGDLLRLLVASHPRVDIRTDLRDAEDAPDLDEGSQLDPDPLARILEGFIK